MIQAFTKIGKKELQGLDYEMKLQKFISTQAINPEKGIKRIPEQFDKNEIIINLDIDKKLIEIKFGHELSKENNKRIMAFPQPANKEKKYFSATNLSYHTVNSVNNYPTIPAMIKFIENYFESDNEMERFLNYLGELRNTFYKPWEDKEKGKKGYYLDFNLLEKDLNDRFKEYAGELFNDSEFINVKSLQDLKNAYIELISKDVIGSSKKNELNNYPIFSIRINGKSIHEGEFRKQYLKVLYYDLFERFFDRGESKVKDNALCSICNKVQPRISGKINLPTKFYQTTESIFFENQIGNNAFKSFGICEDCYEKLLTGINIIRDEFSARLLGIDYYLVPLDTRDNYKKATRFIQRVINRDSESWQEEMENHRDLIIIMQKKNYKFDFLFFETQQAQFIVVKHISEIYYTRIHEIFKKLMNLNEAPLYTELIYKPSLNSIYWLLFPNKNSHANPDSSFYKKEMTGLLDSVFSGNTIHYKNLVIKFMNIFKKSFFRADRKINKLIYNPIRMNILLSFFNSVTSLKGGLDMKEGNTYTEITQESINDFFSVHSDVYDGNFYRQGLVLLGMLIRRILREQKEKSSDFFSKINLDGIPVRRVPKFINDVTEYLNIYDLYNDYFNMNLYSQMIDRLQGIEKSAMNKNEVIFYILTGISLDSYLGYKHSQNIKEKGEKNE
ncbi:MAG: hypothetical protein GF364_00040 [Candidatus Lokiarchaeota archaeon]|nr:hypothetical protein [Candidatus Lokiarchaeota archaeon]